MNTLQKMFKHFSLITRHKWVVFKLCCKVGEVKRGLLHDLSKYSWTEFSEGVKYFNGGHSPIAKRQKDIQKLGYIIKEEISIIQNIGVIQVHQMLLQLCHINL